MKNLILLAAMALMFVACGKKEEKKVLVPGGCNEEYLASYNSMVATMKIADTNNQLLKACEGHFNKFGTGSCIAEARDTKKQVDVPEEIVTRSCKGAKIIDQRERERAGDENRGQNRKRSNRR